MLEWLGALGILVAAASASAATPKFDGRGWTAGNHQENASQILTEYVLPGQTVENWKELVTAQVFKDPRHQVPLEAFVDRIHRSLAQGCPSLVWTVVSQDKGTAVLEYHDAGCGGMAPESDLVRLATGAEGVYRLAYAARIKGQLSPEKRKQWMAILSQVPLAEGGPATEPSAERPE